MRFLRPAFIVFLVLLLDQSLKFWVKLHFNYEHGVDITSWFKLFFIENEGAAFGWKIGGQSGKLILTLFRIVAATGIGYYLLHIIRHKAHPGFIASVALIFAGATGNIIDSVFYGLIFDKGINPSANIFNYDGVASLSLNGYASLFHGNVVDMLYFPIYSGSLPAWIPLFGGHSFVFFRPIFNVADASITTGVILILLFQRMFFKSPQRSEPEKVNSISTDVMDVPPGNENASASS